MLGTLLRRLERVRLQEVTATVEYALDGRPHLACVHVETTPMAAYQDSLEEVVS